MREFDLISRHSVDEAYDVASVCKSPPARSRMRGGRGSAAGTSTCNSSARPTPLPVLDGPHLALVVTEAA